MIRRIELQVSGSTDEWDMTRQQTVTDLRMAPPFRRDNGGIMARVVILAFGSRGDIQPYLALGLGLLRAGYQVRVGAPEEYKECVVRRGLEFRPVPDEQLARPGRVPTEDQESENLNLPCATTLASFNPCTTLYRLL